jgi:hypothetical protein
VARWRSIQSILGPGLLDACDAGVS